MINIKYTSSSLSPSGYAQAARSDIASLFCSGVNVTCESIQQTAEITDYGLEGQIDKYLRKRDIPYKIKILHVTPDLIPSYRENNTYTISRLAWETSKVPKEWIEPLNEIDEIWITASSIEKILRNSGVTTLCTIIPEAIYTGIAEETIEPLLLPIPKDFIFYTIGQWIDRKNIQGLIKAYWKAFKGDDKVSLLLKTYRMNYSEQEYNLIKQEIEELRKKQVQDHYPKLLLVKNLLTTDQILKLHALGDCYVNSSSGEGWGLPVAEAMLQKKPVISGNNGGIMDFITPLYYFKVKSQEVQATENPHIPWYQKDMTWKKIDEEELIQQMHYVYDNYQEAQTVGKKACGYIVDNFSYQKVGKLMLNRLTEIDNQL